MSISLLATSCSKCNGVASNVADSGATASSSAAPSSVTRCARIADPIVLGERDDGGVEGPTAFGVELGTASSDDRGFVIGVRNAGITGAGLVARIPFDGKAMQTWATLPQPAGVGRPPLVALDPSSSIVARLWSAPEGKKRVLGLARLDAAGKLEPIGDLDQQEDESEWSAVLATPSGLLVAWDEADKEGRRGRIRLVRIDPGGKLETKPDAGAKSDKSDAGDPDVVTPIGSDASMPTLVRSPDGKRAILVWLAEKPENVDPPDGGAGEPSQLEAYRWVEAVLIDVATGKPIGAPRALTSTEGHAQTVAAEWTSAGLFLAVRDDARPTDGDGGELAAIKVPIEASALGAPGKQIVAEKDVAPGVALVIAREGGASIGYASPNGELHLVPVFGAGAPSIEPSLQGFRAIAARGPHLLGARVQGRALELVVARCTP